ncbi:ASKHA domain-containing protein [Ihubacter sp. mB4P-1]|uniref:ASKHA domain-containing protein n=1 Tax=Ihubacter sp. mB4P-1 TaxID=3242370 RepID=UPI00137A6C54
MKITFLPQNITWEAEEGETILQAAAKAGVSIDGNCAGMGTCGKCRVKILEGDASEIRDHHHKLTDRDIEAGYRLACCQPVTENMVVEVAEAETTASRKKKLIRLPEGFQPFTAVEKQCVRFNKATLADQRSDEERILSAFGWEGASFTYHALAKLPRILRKKENHLITLTHRDGLIIDVEEGDTEKANYGVAVDIGTTTAVVMLWNCANGTMIDVSAVTNPQGAYGADVISRITFAGEKDGNLGVLQKAVIDCINKAIDDFEAENHICRGNIYQMTVVGNTTMSHVFLGIDPAQLALAPFSPVFTEAASAEARDLGLKIFDRAEVYVAPNIAGHVGSDITAGIITTNLMDRDKGHLFIDIGTNGEIVLTGNGRAVACSTAAGPAFEGSSISQGMRAARGAIETVDIREDRVDIGVIGDCEPVGICGSGIIDAVGELIRTGIVDKSGRLLSREKLEKKGLSQKVIEHVRPDGKTNDFVLYFSPDGKSDVVITQKDVREVQLAKAAIAAGITIMMGEIGVTLDTLETVSIAGAFGSYIRNSSAIHIGLLPKVSEERIVSLGNAAGIGASMILLSQRCRENADKTAMEIEHIELAGRSDFQDEYMTAMMF